MSNLFNKIIILPIVIGVILVIAVGVLMYQLSQKPVAEITYTPEELEVKEVVYDFYSCYFKKTNLEIGMTIERLEEIFEECGDSLADTYKESGPRPIPYPWQDCCPEPEAIVFGEINIGKTGAFAIIDIWGYFIRVQLMSIDGDWKIINIESTTEQ